MRLLIHSNGPWCLTGYGTQCRQLIYRLRDAGHDVAVSAFWGLEGARIEWDGFPVYPKGTHPYGSDVVGMHARHFRADWVITIMDQWALGAETLEGQNVALWMPVDCDPLGTFDEQTLTAKKEVCKRILPIALTKVGQGLLEEAGFGAEYVPHGLDAEVWRPPDDRQALRESMGVAGKFVIFMNAANMDKSRKGFAEQLAAFSRFQHRHSDAMLVLHTSDTTPGGLNLPDTAARMGADVKFNSQYLIAAGLIGPEQLRGSYGMADLYSGCALAEGFGLPLVEASLCGVPVATTDHPVMREVVPGAWFAKAEKTWASGHNAWWRRPLIDSIVRIYERAYERGGPWHAKRASGREQAKRYDADLVFKESWTPVLEKMQAML